MVQCRQQPREEGRQGQAELGSFFIVQCCATRGTWVALLPQCMRVKTAMVLLGSQAPSLHNRLLPAQPSPPQLI